MQWGLMPYSCSMGFLVTLHTGTLWLAWNHIKLCGFSFFQACPPVWQLRRNGMFYHRAQHLITTWAALGWACQSCRWCQWCPGWAWWCGRRCRKEPPFLLISWVFQTTRGKLQLQEWQNCVTVLTWLSQKCQHFETSFKACMWEPLRYPLR